MAQFFCMDFLEATQFCSRAFPIKLLQFFPDNANDCLNFWQSLIRFFIGTTGQTNA